MDYPVKQRGVVNIVIVDELRIARNCTVLTVNLSECLKISLKKVCHGTMATQELVHLLARLVSKVAQSWP